MVFAWLLVGAAIVLAATTTLVSSRQAGGRRLGLVGLVRGWALLPFAFVNPAVLFAWLRASESGGPELLILVFALGAVTAVSVPVRPAVSRRLSMSSCCRSQWSAGKVAVTACRPVR